MPTVTRRGALAGALGLLVGAVTGCSIPGSEVHDGDGISGTYTLNGTDASDVEYSGTVIITASSDPAVYSMQWIITGAIHEGTAEVQGRRVNATWRSVTTPLGADAASSGTASYVLDDSGNLDGTKTIDGVEGHATETIFQEA